MPTKPKVDREDIIQAALELLRQSGSDALSARSVAARLGCSTQPIFSNFPNMRELLSAVLECGWALYLQRTAADMAAGRYPPYKASGLSYISFAVEEPQLFKSLFMRDRVAEGDADVVAHPQDVIRVLRQQTGLSEPDAERLHSEMWIFVHGLAVFAATGFLSFDEARASEMLSDVYSGLVKHYTDKGEVNHD